MQTLHAIARYFLIVLSDGDYLNDYLTWVDPDLAAHLLEVGKVISAALF